MSDVRTAGKPAIAAGTLVDVQPPPRPERKDCRPAAAEALADDVIRWLEETDGKQDRADIVAQLLKVSSYDWSDGYTFAKRLEERGWSPSAELVEILDSAAHLLWQAHDRAAETWVKEHNVRLTLEVGAMVEAEIGGERKRGKVVGTEPKRAVYVVNTGDRPDNAGYLVEGEKVWPIQPQASAA